METAKIECSADKLSSINGQDYELYSSQNGNKPVWWTQHKNPGRLYSMHIAIVYVQHTFVMALELIVQSLLLG